ncbi:hypothetical protein AJ85_19665 [Alkalihalobacillus alcalophilus ATCC 27647 = CGMCC 1.3604]|uniref:Uncharacterized protein n=1 Tax=Alkalihalobacillus alcalophilus ATCC 27647 = CGMCC 1.3604 TaxID=1218173 RepID=A0A094WJ24_ALKAL|nr:hypothetical protein BALCAV_0219285 [Alkalihalobacillus alcalophilus ATCC 27647 = CGMCC 1.3604]THG89099.1 hypothetical protein AJ85_19665 [Alkalihalobacillus alcalophilus ATCC 27647 = CGMCC 1.3604]
MQNIVLYLLRAVFLAIYILVFHFFVWSHLPINSSIGVLVGSLLVFLTSLVLAIFTSNKVVEVLRS